MQRMRDNVELISIQLSIIKLVGVLQPIQPAI